MIETAHITGEDIPLAMDFPTSYDGDSGTQHVFLRLDTPHNSGYGEGSALQNFTGETTATMRHIVEDVFAPEIVGRPVAEALATFRRQADRLPGHPAAKTCVETALLDLKAKELNVPLNELLGIPRRDEIPLAFPSGALPAETVATNVADAYDEGFRSFKIKADGTLSDDVARINAVTDELADRADPSEVYVRVDANTGWETYERAKRAIDRMDRLAYVEYFEQPVATGATEDLRALRTNLGVPVFADEAVHQLDDVRELTQSPSAVSGFCAKLAKTGSPTGIRTIGEMVGSDVPITLVSAFETSLGMAVNLHLASVLPRLSSAAELGADWLAVDPVTRSIATEPVVSVPEHAGIGVELADSLFEQQTVVET
ncbi:MAG: mandelate racemase/muconate lactonizing enzyme family protein [Halobacteriales archaeon]